jgi:uncharacterized phage protein (TIGR01671 family)
MGVCILYPTPKDVLKNMVRVQMQLWRVKSMREIKFRSWDCYENQMHNGVESGIYEDPDEIIPFDKVLELACYEVMQYTGLKDKNGKEIYEGDVLGYVTDTKWIVGFKNGAFTLSYQNSNINILYDCDIADGKVTHMKVLGNIYENPELLEG